MCLPTRNLNYISNYSCMTSYIAAEEVKTTLKKLWHAIA